MIDEVELDDVEYPSNHKHPLKRHITGAGHYENYRCNNYQNEICRLGNQGKSPS